MFRLLRDILVIVVVALCVSFLVKTYLVRSFYIPSASMQPTLMIDDRILVNELVPAPVPLQRGDVVVFEDPGGWLDGEPPSSSPAAVAGVLEQIMSFVGVVPSGDRGYLVKRVIGLPGDEVECCNALGQMSVNGTPLDEPYVQLPDGSLRVASQDFHVTVPADSIWVMGDNRYNSRDSRYNRDKPGSGFVLMDEVVGRAFVVSWPVGRWGVLDGYPGVFAGLGD